MTRWCSSPVILECDMNDSSHKLARRYAATLQKYLADEQEAVLAHAYELGRLAIAEGLGVLDMARSHQEALGEIAPVPVRHQERRTGLKSGGNFSFGVTF